jgi:hypothetical protein
VFNATLAAARRSCRAKSESRRSIRPSTGLSSRSISIITG